MADPELDFEWDEGKARSNLKKHGVSFLAAAAIFRHERIEQVDAGDHGDEIRWVALGRAGTEVYRVVYTWRGKSLVRIISAWRASIEEEEAYYRAIFP